MGRVVQFAKPTRTTKPHHSSRIGRHVKAAVEVIGDCVDREIALVKKRGGDTQAIAFRDLLIESAILSLLLRLGDRKAAQLMLMTILTNL
jgi:hypothetical protein